LTTTPNFPAVINGSGDAHRRENQIVLFLPLDGSATGPFRWTIPLRLIVQALTGKATDVQESLSQTNTPVIFENLHEALTKTFAVAKTSTQKRYEFMSLRQREEHSYHEFALQVEKAGRAY